MSGRKRIAVITGASSGLGREFIRQLDQDAAREEPLFREKPEELWVIARREDRLREVEKETELPVRVLPYDLTDKESILALQELLEDEQPSVRLLINAAGFGKIGATENMTLEALDGMIDLNCRAAVDMTQICLPYTLLVGVWAFVYLFVGGCRGDLLSVAAVCRFDGFGKGEGARCLQKEPSEQREETFIYLVVFHSLIVMLLTYETIFVALSCVRGAWCKSVFGCFVFVFS